MAFLSKLGLVISLYLTCLSKSAKASDFERARDLCRGSPGRASVCLDNNVYDCLQDGIIERCQTATCAQFPDLEGHATCESSDFHDVGIPEISDDTGDGVSSDATTSTTSSSTTSSSSESTTSSSATNSTSPLSACTADTPEFTVDVGTYCAEHIMETMYAYCGGNILYDCITNTKKDCGAGHTCKKDSDTGNGMCIACDSSIIIATSAVLTSTSNTSSIVSETSTSDAGSATTTTVTVTTTVSTSSTTSSSSSAGSSSSSSTDSSSSSSTDSSSSSSTDSFSSSSTSSSSSSSANSSSSSSTDSSSSSSADSSSSTATSASSPSTTDTTFVTSTAPGTSSSSSSGSSSPAPTLAAKRSPESSIALSDLPEAEPTIPGWSTVSSPDTTTTAANGKETLIPADEICALKKPWSATVCHENCVYDCVRRIRLADCAETGCGTFNIGARCYDGDSLRKSDAPHNLPLIADQVALSQGQSALSGTSSTHRALGSPTSSATTSGSTYWPQRLCDAKDHPDDPTLGLYQKHDTVESVCADQSSIVSTSTCVSLKGMSQLTYHSSPVQTRPTETPCKKSRGGGSCCSTGGTALCCQVPGGLRLGFGNETWVKADGSVYATSAGNASEYGTLKEQGRESQYDPKNAGRMGSHTEASNSTTTDFSSSTASTFMTVTTKANSSAPLASSTASDATQTKDSPIFARPCDPYGIIDPFCTSLAAQPTATSSVISIATRSGEVALVEHIKQVGDEIVDVAKHVAENITNSKHSTTATRRDTFGYNQNDLKIRSPDSASVAHDSHGNAIGVYTSVTGIQGPTKPTCTPKPKPSIVSRSGDNTVFERIKDIGNELIKIAKDAINGDRPTTSTEPHGLPDHIWEQVDCNHPLY